jgi:hypothetical protein
MLLIKNKDKTRHDLHVVHKVPSGSVTLEQEWEKATMSKYTDRTLDGSGFHRLKSSSAVSFKMSLPQTAKRRRG